MFNNVLISNPFVERSIAGVVTQTKVKVAAKLKITRPKDNDTMVQ